MTLDFNDAKPNDFELIPENTEVPILIKVQQGDFAGDDCLKRSKNSDALMLNLECTITGGKFARRKFFQGFFVGTESNELTDKQKTGVDMARSKLRAIVEAARGFAPTDETAAAQAARKLSSYMDLNDMECTVILGVEKGQNGFSDKNVIKRVIAHGKAKGDSFDPAAEAAAIRNGAAAAVKQTATARTTASKGW